MNSMLEKYIEECLADEKENQLRGIKNYLIRFQAAISSKEYADLSREDFVKAFSTLNLYGRDTFFSVKPFVSDFAIWLMKKGHFSREQVKDIKSIEYVELDREHLYAVYSFNSYADLMCNLENAIELYNPDDDGECDVAKVIATLLWFGFEIGCISDIKKADVLQHQNCVIHPVTKKKYFFPERAMALIVEYSDATSYTSRRRTKDGYLTLYYKDSQYLVRNTKSAKLSQIQLYNTFKYINSVADEIGKRFIYSKISWSGLCYRVYQDEQNNGKLRNNDFARLRRVFEMGDGELSEGVKIKLRSKYVQYLEFKNRMLVSASD